MPESDRGQLPHVPAELTERRRGGGRGLGDDREAELWRPLRIPRWTAAAPSRQIAQCRAAPVKIRSRPSAAQTVPPCVRSSRREGTRQAEGRAGTLADGRPQARDRPRRGADQGAPDRDLRHRPAHPELGRLGPADHQHAADARSRVRRRGGRDRRRGDRRQRRRPGQRRGPPGLRQVPELSGRAPPPVPQHDRPGRRPGRRVRRVRRAARLQRLGAPGAGRPGRGRDLRPVRQRRAHRALLPAGRRGRADHRRGPDRHHGRRRRQARRLPGTW